MEPLFLPPTPHPTPPHPHHHQMIGADVNNTDETTIGILLTLWETLF